MKNLQEFLAAYVREYGSVKVIVNGDGNYASTSGVIEVESRQEADVYIVNNAEVDSGIAKDVETVVYSSTSKINYRPQHQPNASIVNTKHSEMFIFDNFAVFSTNHQLAKLKPNPITTTSEQVGTTLAPEQMETVQMEELDTEQPETVEELPEGFPFSIAGAETEEELDSVDMLAEEDEEGDEPKKVW